MKENVTGLKKIISAYDKYPVKPTIETTDNFFVVTLPNVKVGTQDENYFDDTNVTNNVINNVANVIDRLTSTEKEIFKLLKASSDITAEELAERTSKTKRTGLRAIVTLKDKGYIERIGNNKKGFWKVLK